MTHAEAAPKARPPGRAITGQGEEESGRRRRGWRASGDEIDDMQGRISMTRQYDRSAAERHCSSGGIRPFAYLTALALLLGAAMPAAVAPQALAQQARPAPQQSTPQQGAEAPRGDAAR